MNLRPALSTPHVRYVVVAGLDGDGQVCVSEGADTGVVFVISRGQMCWVTMRSTALREFAAGLLDAAALLEAPNIAIPDWSAGGGDPPQG